MALHTTDGCSISHDGSFTGSLSTANCFVNATGQPQNAGCGIHTQDTRSYGNDFNANRGGVYATEWTSSAIKIWFFPRGTIPADITHGDPDPVTWGQPAADFHGGCDIDAHFRDQHIVIDTTFCGVWAGGLWNFSGTCAALAPTCKEYVRMNPAAFVDAYWTIYSLQVYREVE